MGLILQNEQKMLLTVTGLTSYWDSYFPVFLGTMGMKKKMLKVTIMEVEVDMVQNYG